MGKEIWSMLYKLYKFGKFGPSKTNARAPKTKFSAISCFFETLAHTWIKLGDS